MKANLMIAVMLLAGPFLWAAPQTFDFVTTLSSPIASFKEVETRYAANPTQFETGEVNLGSHRAGGNINIQGGEPMRVNTLTMEEGTGFKVTNNKKWIVNQLTIGPYGTVRPDHAHIDTLQVPNNITLQATTLILKGPVFFKGGRVDSVTVGGANNFNVPGGGSGGSVKLTTKLGCNPKSQDVGLCTSSSPESGNYVFVVE